MIQRTTLIKKSIQQLRTFSQFELFSVRNYSKSTSIPVITQLENMRRRLREEKTRVAELKSEIKSLKLQLALAQKQAGKKVKKDPNAPKRPLSSYLIFANEVRDEVSEDVKREAGKYDVGLIGKKIGERWNNLDDDSKQRYFEKQESLRREYEQSLREYESSLRERSSSL